MTNYILKCPKCYKTRAAESRYKSWKCFRCGYVMNKKNTKIQAETINIKENQIVINSLDNKEY
jgi:ribosomal protein L37AE/L43A